MNKVLPFALALLVSTPVLAKDVTITLNDEEQKVFIALLDGALKSGGIANLKPVIAFIDKYQKAAGVGLPATPPAAPAAPEAPGPEKTPEKK